MNQNFLDFEVAEMCRKVVGTFDEEQLAMEAGLPPLLRAMSDLITVLYLEHRRDVAPLVRLSQALWREADAVEKRIKEERKER